MDDFRQREKRTALRKLRRTRDYSTGLVDQEEASSLGSRLTEPFLLNVLQMYGTRRAWAFSFSFCGTRRLELTWLKLVIPSCPGLSNFLLRHVIA
ncbi:uncharacterized protein LOC131164210 isoform X2 [Malania oleifera]|uniref:uncharacterized protein LOC131164210 isoform X2 n=1 Tax=Malania oleifera TaxID=397392 RepID=UPI0025AE647A|nr:uncharacterized protein LOC131164210 isoform X2 [Malania oleifera]